ncbi:RES family NAD+ phosphorylase [Flavobacterium rakeshii]|uniref:RES family NAD+ phosphorylase n=1 Tax=Flavobacterium rakeshii TaxID=1038845 RepID=UPI002E7B92B4|nr:RES family NAD+ phosphorylase [Flavobacterium rakeshii]MEE1899568.1 RES family NAD+ phosphorylase [Flavobacterium rakeshii]
MEVCSTCFKDLELVSFIDASSSRSDTCNWCKTENARLIDFTNIEDFFNEFLEIFEPNENGIPIKQLIDDDWKIFNTENDELLTEIFQTLKFPHKTDTKVYYTTQITENIAYWDTLKESLKWSFRFITNTRYLIEELGWDAFFNRQRTLNENETLFRARIHNNDREDPYQKEKMGCPPKDLASSGRANPFGIPYLYLSKSIETTFYETRSLYLDEVSVGDFTVKSDEEIILVDFTETPSAFANSDNLSEYTKAILLKRRISSDLSKPLRRYDSELEYIPTQFICEFIRSITGSDGIIFNSSLHIGGVNVVLFNEEKIECKSVKKYQVSSVEIKHTPVE